MKPTSIKWPAFAALLGPRTRKSILHLITSLNHSYFRAVILFPVLSVIVLTFLIAPGLPVQAAYSGYPTFSVVTIVTDQKVTIETQNLPVNDRFDVRMGLFGSLGWGNYVTTIDSAGGGKLKFELTLPAALKGQDRIAIRIDSPTSGYYAYNWFWNNAGTNTTPTPQPTQPSGTPKPTLASFTGNPYFSIASVTRNGKVSINPSNFPANDSFEVTMNLYGTLGKGGYKVDTVTTDANGKLSSVTFNIPSQLADQSQIAIRLESSRSGYYAFNWLWNFSTP